MAEAILRRFARDQWVRVHGTPRVTVLVGGDLGRLMWLQWLRAGGLEGTLVDSAIGIAVPQATSRAMAAPQMPIAISCSRAELAGWRAGRADRLAAMVDEGVVEVPDEVVDADPVRRGAALRDAGAGIRLFEARSAAEAALFEALEATPATAGKFELNGKLSVRFGPAAAEVDVVARREKIAIEIDGFHHFGDLEAYRRDRRKDLLLQTEGYLVLRVLAHDVMQDARPMIAAVCQALAHRAQ
jgi:very-short-patch-repair endonuclease